MYIFKAMFFDSEKGHLLYKEIVKNSFTEEEAFIGAAIKAYSEETDTKWFLGLEIVAT